jgi:hypothetical protein
MVLDLISKVDGQEVGYLIISQDGINDCAKEAGDLTVVSLLPCICAAHGGVSVDVTV